jgi:4-aminobutyrate aminotransferase-like enzyme
MPKTVSRETLELLRGYESRNVTFIEPDGSWPIVWDRAQGVYVWDADGKKYLDLTAAFGVAAAGHANPRVVRAGQIQMAKLLHAMGDVHPHRLKAQLARELSRLTFERWSAKAGAGKAGETPAPLTPGRRPTAGGGAPLPGRTGKTIFCNSGFEAVEAALKTAMLATRKPGVIAFADAYHGLGYGALNVTARAHFRSPFRRQLNEFGRFVPFPRSEPGSPSLPEIESRLRRLCRREQIGAVLVEPVQVRGGINIPPPEFLPRLRRLCDQEGALLILDEIYTGFGRTGKWFACEHSDTIPDLICLGKALTGGFPLSACVGRADIMDAAWPPSQGEAIHTSTFLGHPVGCAMALAQIAEIHARRLVQCSAELGSVLLSELEAVGRQDACSKMIIRGIGLLAGVELRGKNGQPDTLRALRVIKALLHRGYLLLPEGGHGNVISFTPPLTITRKQIAAAGGALAKELKRSAGEAAP